MADAQETIADIIAEMRRGTRLPGYWHSCDVNKILQYHADRFEAVWKRDTKELRVEIERLKEERNYSGVRERERLRAKGFAIVPKEQLERGDAAKLREALVKCRDIALQWQADEAAGVAGTTDKPHARSAAEAVVDMEFEINAALSAPPRNCDRPECATTKAAQDVWRKESGGKTAYYEWLLATHEKGNNDADK